MMERIKAGILSGALGAEALNFATYVDIAVRGRPESPLPSRSAKMLGEKVGIRPLAGESETARNRRRGAGALMGYANGISLGIAYALARPLLGRMPLPGQVLGVAVAAMASSNVPAVFAGLTDPKQWSSSDWLADIVPHVAYGAATVWGFENIAND